MARYHLGLAMDRFEGQGPPTSGLNKLSGANGFNGLEVIALHCSRAPFLSAFLGVARLPNHGRCIVFRRGCQEAIRQPQCPVVSIHNGCGFDQVGRAQPLFSEEWMCNHQSSTINECLCYHLFNTIKAGLWNKIAAGVKSTTRCVCRFAIRGFLF